MKQEAMQKHPEEWFFLHNFDVDRVFSTIRPLPAAPVSPLSPLSPFSP